MLLISFPSYSFKDLINRTFNLVKFANGSLPDYIFNNGAWFLYLSNEIEAERIKSENDRRLRNLNNSGKYKVKR